MVWLFNQDNRLDKWKVYALLCGTPRLKEHVPAIDRVSPDTVVSSLQKYPQIYLKPCDSSLAKGIFRLEQLEEGSVEMGSPIVEDKVGPPEEAVNQVLQTGRPYLVQQGLDWGSDWRRSDR